MEFYVQHPNCVWGDQVDFIVHLIGPYDEESIAKEQVGCKQVAPNLVKLCCLPFYVYGYTLGDILEISPNNYDVLGIHQKSGRHLFRIIFKCGSEKRQSIVDRCSVEFGALFEWVDDELCAVDVETPERAQKFFDEMVSEEREGVLEFETGVGSGNRSADD